MNREPKIDYLNIIVLLFKKNQAAVTISNKVTLPKLPCSEMQHHLC